ncbi:MAG: class I SAM-dependent RNA methyltransferase [Ruminococcus sp.]|nr:class I SAM-dependent RNA methyltransferase [Ruminococcus sp.]
MATHTHFSFSCPCHFGLERTLRFELSKIGAENISTENGRVNFQGDALVLAKANLCLTTAERVLLKLGEFSAYTFEELFQGMRKIPLEQFIGKDDAFPVKGHALDSKLHSVPDCQSILKKAAVERLKAAYHMNWFSEAGANHPIRFQIRNNHAVIYLDTTGVGLHKRGYRRNANAAPIKETLAAGIVDLAQVRSDSVVCDPFCGSGTLLIEAVFKAMRIAPGLHRRFLAETWAQIPTSVWEKAREEAVSNIRRDAAFTAIGSDIDPEAIALTEENCRRAGVMPRVRLEQMDVADFHPQAGAITICNPPYGERMLDIERSQSLYRIMGQVFPADRNHPCAIITPDVDFKLHFGKEADKRRKLYNGMIACQLFQYFGKNESH